MLDALQAILRTWPEDVRPKIHFSSPRTELREIIGFSVSNLEHPIQARSQGVLTLPVARKIHLTAIHDAHDVSRNA
jgi:hypothetical protein